MNDTILNTLDFISETGRKALLHIGEELANGNVVLFAGAGLSFNAPSKDGGVNRMPGWNDMAKVLLDRLESDIKDKWDVLKIADYYQTAFGRSVLVEKIVEAVRDDQHVPGRVHQCLAQLNFREIITTNYDTLIERAFRSLYVTPQVVVEGPDLVRRRQPPRIIKMNGCFERNPSKIIVTGDDFLAHSQRDPLIEVFVTKSFVESQVLFIGFSLNDPAFRAINERVLQTLGKDCPVAFSMQFGAGETETKYWSTRQVQVIDLKSGAPSELSGEERIYRVMQALLQIQRAQLAPMPHVVPGVSPAALVKKSDAPCADPAAVLQKAFPSAAREQIDAFMVCDGAREILAHLFGGGPLSEPSARLALADFLCAATGLAGADGPVVQDNSRWATVWTLVALISEAIRNDPTDGAVDANLTVLCALFMLQFIVAAPECSAALNADDRLLEAASRLTFDCLLSHDMAVRSRHLHLLLLLAPLDDLARLANCWTNGSPERDLYLKSDGANEERKRLLRVEPTPDEYRLPILSFFNVLQERPVFYQEAAESLWSRELVGATENGDNRRSRYEATLRYRYLLQLANEHAHDWPGVHLHQERLVRVLGSRALLAEGSESPADYAVSLQQMLTELARGWLFGSPAKIRGLKRTWQQARTARTAGEPQRVPYFVQLVTTLLVEGADAVNAPQHHELLVDAWHGGLIDVVVLMRYIARRVGDAKFTRLAVMADDPRRKRPLVRYEEGLAALAAWIAERIDEEGQASPLRAAAFEHLAAPVENWLPKTRSEAVRANLVRVLSLMNRWDPDRTRPLFRTWLEQQTADGSRGTLPLAEFDTDGALLADRPLARLLLGRARSQRKGRTDVRNDVETWFVRFADLPSTDGRVIGEFAADVVEWMEEEKATFGWIDRAARICCSTRLRQAVEQQDVIRASGGLARYVVGRLQALEPKAAKMWPEKRSAFLGELAVFAPELDLAMRRFLLDMIEPVDLLTEDGREGAAWLAIKMIEANAGDGGDWATRLGLLIEQGATGRGRFGPYWKYLPTTYPRKVESNLLVMLERRWDTNDPEIIAMIERMIGESLEIVFPDLEAALCQLLTSNRRPLAAYAAASLVRLSGTTAIVDRNEQRIRRTEKVIALRSAINGFRASSAFMEALNGLFASTRESATLLSPPPATAVPLTT
jgi:hypothetical protein